MSNQQPIVYKAMTRLELEQAYKVNYFKLYKWLKLVPNLDPKYKHTFSPKEVKMIFEHLGEPEGFNDF